MTVALTIHQPYASLIAHGVKEWETRPHPPAGWPGITEGVRRMPGVRVEPGEMVLIHAGAKAPRAQSLGEWRVEPNFCGSAVALGPQRDDETFPAVRLPLGAVVATARITDVVPIVTVEGSEDRPGPWITVSDRGLGYWRGQFHVAERISDQLPYGDWTCGRWAWRLDDIVKLREPVAARGRQGVWRPDESLVAACEESSP